MESDNRHGPWCASSCTHANDTQHESLDQVSQVGWGGTALSQWPGNQSPLYLQPPGAGSIGTDLVFSPVHSSRLTPVIDSIHRKSTGPPTFSHLSSPDSRSLRENTTDENIVSGPAQYGPQYAIRSTKLWVRPKRDRNNHQVSLIYSFEPCANPRGPAEDAQTASDLKFSGLLKDPQGRDVSAELASRISAYGEDLFRSLRREAFACWIKDETPGAASSVPEYCLPGIVRLPTTDDRVGVLQDTVDRLNGKLREEFPELDLGDCDRPGELVRSVVEARRQGGRRKTYLLWSAGSGTWNADNSGAAETPVLSGGKVFAGPEGQQLEKKEDLALVRKHEQRKQRGA